jgi:glycosyltransferase involved in cell wall biosynthesis
LDGVRFVGEKSDVQPYLALFDVLIVPSEWEPFGITILEAMAMEKPVIAFDVDGIPEVVQDKVTGLLTPHRDVTALAQAITLLVDSPGLRTDLGKSGRQRVQHSFRAAVTARELERIYQELVGARLA